jgi:hypothetical protein
VLKTPIDNNTIAIHVKIIAGLISGIIAAALLVCALVFAFKRLKTTSTSNITTRFSSLITFFIIYKGNSSELSENINEEGFDQINYDSSDKSKNDIEFESTSQSDEINAKYGLSVLIIYNYDCEEHFNVIKAFVHFLREVSLILLWSL